MHMILPQHNIVYTVVTYFKVLNINDTFIIL